MGLLRALLAISVVIAHSSPIFGFSLVGGQIAVQAFYMISGFYMALILKEKYIGVNGSYKLFITNRLLRLYPIYWTVFLLTIMFSIIVFFISHGNNIGKLTYYYDYFSNLSLLSFLFLIFTNIFIVFQDLVMFLGLNVSNGNLFFSANFSKTSPMLYEFLMLPQTWTIGIEISFYLIAPFLIKLNLKSIFLLIILSLLLRIFLIKINLAHDPWSYRFFPAELVFFLLGIVDYNIYKKIQMTQIKPLYLKSIFVFILSFTLLSSFIPFSGKLFIYLFAFFISIPFVFILFKRNNSDRYIGELSYPIYISHILLLMVLSYFKIPVLGGQGLTLVILTICFSFLLNKFVSEKIENIRQKRIAVSE